MRKEARLLKAKSIESIVVCVDHFNRQWDVGRTDSVLILLDHAFEMLLKAALSERTGRIRDNGEDHTYTFERCLRIGRSDKNAMFLNDDQVLTLQAINGLRDAAQHHLVDLSEGVLYIQVQSGVTLFDDLLQAVFNERLRDHFSERVLPVATIAPLNPVSLFHDELEEVRKLLRPRTRRGTEAKARLRGLAILDGAISGEIAQPGERRLRQLTKAVRSNSEFDDVFPGIAAVTFVTDGSGIDLSLRLTKREGLPVQLVPEGQRGGSVIAVKRVNELDFYSLGHKDLASKVGLTQPKLTAVVQFSRMKDDRDCFKQITVGKSVYGRYSPKAIDRVKCVVEEHGIAAIWDQCKPTRLAPR